MELVVRATIVYWFLWLVMRGVGKRSLSEISPLELLITIVLGDLVQQAVTQEDMSVTGGMIVVSTFVAWVLVGDALTRRFTFFERALDGQAVVVLVDGSPDLDRLRRERLRLSDLVAAAREQGYGDLSDIHLGVLEHDGKFSFVKSTDE
jgi:uncharacterized membrane protein YcaP (DUF421 family)